MKILYKLILILAISQLTGCLIKLEPVEGLIPRTPTNIVGTGFDGVIVVDWDKMSTAVRYTILWQEVDLDGSVGPVQQQSVNRPFTHTGLRNGQRYSYALIASNSAGNSDATVPITVMPVGTLWQENWSGVQITAPTETSNTNLGSNPSCFAQADFPDTCTLQIIATGANVWRVSRSFGAAGGQTTEDAPLTFIKFGAEFPMGIDSNGIPIQMESPVGLNMDITVEALQPSYLISNDISVPVNEDTLMGVLLTEAIFNDLTTYSYVEIGPNPQDTITNPICQNKRIRYVFDSASPEAVTAIPDTHADPSNLIVVNVGGPNIESPGVRYPIYDDLAAFCAPNEYVIGSFEFGLAGFEVDANFTRWRLFGIFGPPLL